MALVCLMVCGCQPARESITFRGTVKDGEPFQHPFGGRFIFKLEPYGGGGFITVSEKGRKEDLSRWTPPLHGPNDRDMQDSARHKA